MEGAGINEFGFENSNYNAEEWQEIMLKEKLKNDLRNPPHNSRVVSRREISPHQTYWVSPESYFTDFGVSNIENDNTPSSGLFRHKISRLDSDKTRPKQQMGDDSFIEEELEYPEQDHSEYDDCKKDDLPPSEVTDHSDITRVERPTRIQSQNPVQP
jgi:hypothetical protein